MEKDFCHLKETSLFILVARLSHMTTPSCKGIWEM